MSIASRRWSTPALDEVNMSDSSRILMRRSVADPDLGGNDWTLALAGGDGARLAAYIRSRFGRAVPKQYCRLLGARSMLEHTLDRLNRLTPPSRTLTVIGTHHDEFVGTQLDGRSNHVLCQPESRDTGVALFAALAIIRRWSPDALVTVTPTDQYVAPPSAYVAQLRAARGVASRLRDSIVILGVRPEEPDSDFGYIVTGPPAAQLPRVRHVTGFVEKPSHAVAGRLLAGGALWNTMVTCSTLGALWGLARETQPALLADAEALSRAIGTDGEDEALHAIYRAPDPIGFSRDMLARAPGRLMAMELVDLEWTDWGRPERVEATLARRRLPVRRNR
jgi:mannose-1-phosphate guanylyltransferase